MKNEQKKFLRARNIILIILMIGSIGGCTIFANKQKKAETENLELLNSLPELTTTAQILEAINAPQEKTYVINNYQFPRFTTVGDPYNYLTDSYIYVSVSVSEEGNDGKSHENPNLRREAYGRLFFDENTELLGFKNAIVSVAGSSQKKSRGGYYYYYSTLEPDAKLSFVAKLGDGEARVSSIDGNRQIVEGDKTRLAKESKDSTFNFLLKIACGIVCGFLGLFVLADWVSIKEKKEKSKQRQQSKQARKNDKHKDFFKKK
ncbi:MAG: hypothetical protein NDJ65_06065 [Paludibacteraceae bacterium]|nr:hypothetical protein [Paludibacteraceae bacterium]